MSNLLNIIDPGVFIYHAKKTSNLLDNFPGYAYIFVVFWSAGSGSGDKNQKLRGEN